MDIKCSLTIAHCPVSLHASCQVRIHGNKDTVQTNSGGYSSLSLPTVGPSRRNPALTPGVGGCVPARKLISVASQFNECRRSTSTVCMCALECGVMGTGARRWWGVECRRVGVWETKPGMVGIFQQRSLWFTVYQIERDYTYSVLVFIWWETFHIFKFGNIYSKHDHARFQQPGFKNLSPFECWHSLYRKLLRKRVSHLEP